MCHSSWKRKSYKHNVSFAKSTQRKQSKRENNRADRTCMEIMIMDLKLGRLETVVFYS